MNCLDSIPFRPLATLAAALSLATIAGAQTYTARAGDNVGGNGDQSIGSFPVTAFWDGTWTQSVRHARSRAHRGALNCTTYCSVNGFYNMEAHASAEFRFDDLVFTSPGTAPIQVGLNLSLEGNSSVVNGNGFNLTLRYAGTQIIGQATLGVNGVTTASGGLAGWSMTTLHSFVHTITVPVNTPVNLRINMAAFASAVAGGHIANGHYTLRLGGATPIPSPGERYEVFDLPPGVSVNSVTARITNNIWTSPWRLHLSTNHAVVAPGESLRLEAWNGDVGAPVALSIGWGTTPVSPGIRPMIWRAFTGTLNSEGWWEVDSIQNAPALAGMTMFVRAHSLDLTGRPTRSRRLAIQFQ